MQTISIFRDAKIVNSAKNGNTLSGIAKETGIPFQTVRRIVHALADLEVIRLLKIGKVVTVRVNKDHLLINSMNAVTQWIRNIVDDPHDFVAEICQKNKINYAFVGTSKAKYVKNQMQNKVQIAILKKDFVKGKKIINKKFANMGIKITTQKDKVNVNDIVVSIDCFPVEKIILDKKFQTNTMIRISSTITESNCMRRKK